MSNVDPDNEATYEVCTIRNDLRETARPKETIVDLLRQHAYSEQAAFGVKLALEEALTNAVKHGNRNDPAKHVTIRFAVSDEKAVIMVRDEGPGFAPDQVPDCTSPDRLPLPNGRGIMLIRAYMDEVCFRDNGREVCMMKRRT
ncbi:MAG: ATP-binding protein [Planctomycetes bacterium]|nr:ATP-binding protein [Planctomycetota bacterium]